jgi:hypothetical protein
MIRFGGRTILVFGAYIGVLLAAVAAGIIGQRVGIWASVLWGVLLIGGLGVYLGRRGRRPQTGS